MRVDRLVLVDQDDGKSKDEYDLSVVIIDARK